MNNKYEKKKTVEKNAKELEKTEEDKVSETSWYDVLKTSLFLASAYEGL